MGEDEKPLKVREAADRLGVDYGTIRGAIEQGSLIATDHQGSYRIRPEDLAAYREGLSRPLSTKSRPSKPGPPASPELADARSFAEQIKRWTRRPGLGQPGRSEGKKPGED